MLSAIVRLPGAVGFVAKRYGFATRELAKLFSARETQESAEVVAVRRTRDRQENQPSLPERAGSVPKMLGAKPPPAATQIRIPLPAFTRFHSHEPSRTEEFSSVLSSTLGARICQFRRPRTCSLYSFSGRPGRLRMPLSLSEAHPGKLPQVSLGVRRGV